MAANILMITMGGTRSHKIPFLALGHGLLDRGHQVTLLSAFPPAGEAAGAARNASQSIREVTPAALVFYVRNYTDWDLLGARMRGEDPVSPAMMVRYGYEACEALLSDPETWALVRSRPRPDLLVLDGAYPECALGLAHRLRPAPFIYLNTVGFYTGSLSLAGNPAPFALTPFLGAAFTDRMGLLGRAANAAWHCAAQLLHAAMVHFFLQPVLRRHIGPSMPGVYELSRNVSFVLQNGHAVVSYPRAYLPNVAEVACIHCRAPRPLPQELEEWVSGGAGGFVYVSMGSSVRAANMPAELRVLLADALGRLPFRVLWKWDGGAPAPAHLPPNVRTGHWFPQQDLLGHPRIRAFVTHGGLLSLHEAVHHAVPVVALPVFCDHDANAAKAAADGYALRLELRALSAQRLADAVQRAVRDPRYRNAARERSVLLRDQPETPLQRAIYWSEYVIRHRGAEHLLSPAREMSLVQYFLLDVIALYAAALVLLVVTAKRAVRLLLPSFVTAKKLKAQ
ncbi:hypothetical protein R5R35_007400 [Gryllus longicercus]|uniref:UDP-glucuronosyltransferase n=1 Tax=Gryllus longicercus TaxID=2509291 RepID=A0AAN9Z771_9ORTH